MTLNPFVPVARFALDYDRRQTEAGRTYHVRAAPMMGWFTAPFVVASGLGCTVLFVNAANDRTSMVPAFISLFVPFLVLVGALSAFTKMREMHVSDDRRLVDEALEICKMIVKDKTLDKDWRRRAAAVRSALQMIEARRRRYELLPSIDMGKLSTTVSKLHEAAVALAHYQMLVGLSTHAEIVAHDVDAVLDALEALPV